MNGWAVALLVLISFIFGAIMNENAYDKQVISGAVIARGKVYRTVLLTP